MQDHTAGKRHSGPPLNPEYALPPTWPQRGPAGPGPMASPRQSRGLLHPCCPPSHRTPQRSLVHGPHTCTWPSADGQMPGSRQQLMRQQGYFCMASCVCEMIQLLPHLPIFFSESQEKAGERSAYMRANPGSQEVHASENNSRHIHGVCSAPGADLSSAQMSLLSPLPCDVSTVIVPI